MTATIPRFEVRDPARTCWTCEHGQPIGYDAPWPPPYAVEPPLIRRFGFCCFSPLRVSMLAAYSDPALFYEQKPGYYDQGGSQGFNFQVLNDLSQNWCSQWRRSSLPVPPVPPLPGP